MKFLQGINLNQLADYVFVGGTILGFILFIGLIGAVNRIKKDISKIREESAYNQEILLSQITVLKQIRDGRDR